MTHNEMCFKVPCASVAMEGPCALNRVRWSSGGKEVAVGDSEGGVGIYDVGEVRCSTSVMELVGVQLRTKTEILLLTS